MSDDEMSDDEGEVAAVSYGNAQEFSNYNNGLASSNSVKNTIVLNEVLPGPFRFEGPGGDLQMDTELMDSVTVISEDPLSIEYVVNADAAWSDGEPIDCDDFHMTWQVYGGTHLQLDDDGNPLVDEETETELQLFEITGTTGYDVIDSFECSDDGKTFTTSYSEIFADWKASFGVMPAHVVAAAAGIDSSFDAFESGDRAAIEAMAEFFNNGWSMNPGELLDPALIPSGGKYALGSWEAGSSLTLVPNENYWGTKANAPLTIRYIAEESQSQALANGEINAMDPQPTTDLIDQLEGIDGIVIEGGSQFVWEHFDFNFNNEALANRDVREAFANCLPRQQMVSNLILPLDPSATILNNRYNQQFEPAYVDASAGAYDEVNIERANELLANSGVALTIDIRIGWFDNGGNARRTDQIALTQASCNQLAAGDWDIAMFAWAGSPLKTGSSEIYRTGGGINFGGYGNDAVDALLDEINTTPDADQQAKLANDVDAILWEDLVTIPVFSFPGVLAYSDNIDGVTYNPSQNGLTWNSSAWQIN